MSAGKSASLGEWERFLARFPEVEPDDRPAARRPAVPAVQCLPRVANEHTPKLRAEIDAIREILTSRMQFFAAVVPADHSLVKFNVVKPGRPDHRPSLAAVQLWCTYSGLKSMRRTLRRSYGSILGDFGGET